MKKKLLSLFDAKLWKFLLVGVLNTLVGNGLMFLLYNWAGLGYWPSTAISYALASVMSYFLNRSGYEAAVKQFFREQENTKIPLENDRPLC